MADGTACKRVLLVDDEPAARDMLARVLSARNFEVDTADGGANALKLAETTNYDVAILDYLMPQMNGVELFRAIRQFQPETVGIFLTGYPTIDTVFPAVEAGIQRCFAKPVDASELIDYINNTLAAH